MKWTPLKIMVFVLILGFYASLLTHKITLPVYDDLPRQVKIGELIMHGNFDILYKNIFSYTEPNYTFYNHHWLSAVIFYILHILMGWGGLVVLKVIVLLSAFSLLFFTALKKANFWLVSIVSVPTIIILSERTGLRPEIFSYLFIAIFLYILFDFEEHPERKRIFWLIPLQLLWVNMHVFFSIGIMLVGGFLLEKVIQNYKVLFSNFKETVRINLVIRKLGIVLLAIFLISFVNPRGVHGVFYHYATNFPSVISENQSLSQFQKTQVRLGDMPIATFKLSVFLCATFLIFYFWKNRKSGKFVEKLPIFYLLGGLATAVLGFWMLRALALFGIMFFLIFTDIFNDTFVEIKKWLQVRYPKIKNLLIFVFVLIFVYLLLPTSRVKISPYTEFGIGLTEFSNSSAQFFKDNNLHGPIFNDADVGSYLIYNLYPKEQVFSDNRFGDAYSPKFFDQVIYPMLNNEDAWIEYSKKYDFQTIFLYQYDGGPGIRDFMWRRIRDSAWALVYVDVYNVIFVRNITENKALIEKFGITKENVGERLKNLADSGNFDYMVSAADMFNLIGREDLAELEFLSVVYKWPEKGKIWMVMGEWELSRTQYRSHELAMMYLERAINEGEKSAEAYSFLGMAYNALGQKQKAIEALKQAISINPDRRDAKSLLLQIEN